MNCKKYRTANHETNFPMADERLISIKYISIMISFRRRASPLFHLNIVDQFMLVSAFESWLPGVWQTSNNSWLNSIGPDQNKQSKCHFFMGTTLQVLLYGSSRWKYFFFDEEYQYNSDGTSNADLCRLWNLNIHKTERLFQQTSTTELIYSMMSSNSIWEEMELQ